MKYAGIASFIFGIWLFYISRHDPVEGQLMRPVGFIIAALGFLFFFEGLKNEIIAAIKDSKKEIDSVQKSDS